MRGKKKLRGSAYIRDVAHITSTIFNPFRGEKSPLREFTVLRSSLSRDHHQSYKCELARVPHFDECLSSGSARSTEERFRARSLARSFGMQPRLRSRSHAANTSYKRRSANAVRGVFLPRTTVPSRRSYENCLQTRSKHTHVRS